MPEPFTVPAQGVVPYKYFTVDPGFTEDVWFRGTEARPGNRKVVHHMLLFYLPPEQAYSTPEDPLFKAVAGFAPACRRSSLPWATVPEFPPARGSCFRCTTRRTAAKRSTRAKSV